MFVLFEAFASIFSVFMSISTVLSGSVVLSVFPVVIPDMLSALVSSIILSVTAPPSTSSFTSFTFSCISLTSFFNWLLYLDALLFSFNAFLLFLLLLDIYIPPCICYFSIIVYMLEYVKVNIHVFILYFASYPYIPWRLS